MTPRQREILESMRHGPITTAELASETGKNPRTLVGLFTMVHKAGWTERHERKLGNTGSNWEYVYSLSDAGRREIGPDTSGSNPFLWRSYKQPVQASW